MQGLEVHIHSFLPSALDNVDLSTSNPDRLNPYQKPRYMWVPELIWTVWAK